MSPVASMAKLEMSTSDARDSFLRSRNELAVKMMGSVVVGLAVFRDVVDSGANTPGLIAKVGSTVGVTIDRTTLPSKSNLRTGREG